MGMTYLESLRAGLHSAMEEDDRVYLIGEDLLDPYGGAFKVSQGLSTRFPSRVLPTPISESAIVGIATGMAMRGMRPVAEIMFGDFLALCADQILNSATKFPLMYAGKVDVPIVIRTPMGGGRGYGPTHSQSIEKMFFGIPGLTVLSPSLFHDGGALLSDAIRSAGSPVLFIESKSLYGKRLLLESDILRARVLAKSGEFPTVIAENFVTGVPDVVVIAYGGASEQVSEVMIALAPEEIRVRAILPSLLNSPTEMESWTAEIPTRTPILVAEHGTSGFDWGSEVCAILYGSMLDSLGRPITRLAARNGVIPSDKAKEQAAMLTTGKLMNALLEALV